ncbi:hypothetical protein C3942_00765 [Solimonas fluminis]|uniref:Uncharacterized protein n=1 Tax=Solimonas fluminis TaxID=2086571 RepID=A0A2S5TKD7_9GAMM|nr:hypothetical protein [Solimonas fluminis]PPE75460.1 hypothetical protein C3942_00765 [Solimonas fluminis]
MIPLQTRVYLIDKRHVAAILRGEGCIANLPFDAELVGYSPGKDNALGVLYFSATFAPVPRGEQVPMVPAVFRKRA